MKFFFNIKYFILLELGILYLDWIFEKIRKEINQMDWFVLKHEKYNFFIEMIGKQRIDYEYYATSFIS